MMALAFLLAAWTMSIELKRKEKLGLVQPVTKQILVGAPATLTELLGSAIVGFLIGFKFGYVLFHYSEFVNDTQGVLLSSKGNYLFGIAIAFVSGGLRFREKQKQKLSEPMIEEVTIHPYELVGNITMVAAVSGILGAKLFHNLENLDEFMRDPIDALVSFSGLTIYGGLILGAISVSLYAKKNKISPIHVSDAITPGLMLAYGVGRIGCHLSGDGDWGVNNLNPKPNWLNWLPDWAWSFNYPNNVINEGIPIPGCVGHHCHMLPDAVYPTPFYEAVFCILLFFFLWSIRKRITTPFMMTCIYALLNGIERFSIEKIRINNKFNVFGYRMTQAEIISSLVIIISISLMIYLKRNKKSEGVTL